MPTISSITPAAGPDEGGTRVTITGSGFSAATPVVDFSGLLATGITVNSDTELECDTPWELAISPETAATTGGTAFTLTGQGFNSFDELGGDTVTIGGSNATSLVVVSDTEITGETPSGTSGAADVAITIGATTTTLEGEFTYSPWTPSEITTTLWLDPSDSGTITLDGSGNVEDWNDKSGNANHISQTSTPSYRAALLAAGLNGLDVLNFTASHRYELGGSLMGASVTELSVFAVVEPQYRASVPNFHTIVSQGQFSSEDFLFVLDSRASFSPTFISDTSRIDGTATHTAGTPVLVGAVGKASDQEVFTDGTSSGTETETFDPGGTRSFILGDDGSSTRWFRGKMAEVIVLDYYPTVSDRQRIEGYLAHKWGLETNLPGAHPYKSSPP